VVALEEEKRGYEEYGIVCVRGSSMDIGLGLHSEKLMFGAASMVVVG
jgi:hypothetical protein